MAVIERSPLLRYDAALAPRASARAPLEKGLDELLNACVGAFFGAFPGRSILSVVESKRDPRRYKMHAGFRGYCWVECDEGAAGGADPPEDRVDARAPAATESCKATRSVHIV